MYAMYRVLKIIDYILTKVIEVFLAITFIAIFIMVFYQIILRYVFSTSLFGTAEVYTMLFTYSAALGSALMMRNREHIKIDIFINRIPRKPAKVILTINYLLIGTLCFFIAWQSISWLDSIKNFRSPVTDISRPMESIMIPIGFFLTVFYCIVNILSLFLDPKEAEKEFKQVETDLSHMIAESPKANEGI